MTLEGVRAYCDTLSLDTAKTKWMNGMLRNRPSESQVSWLEFQRYIFGGVREEAMEDSYLRGACPVGEGSHVVFARFGAPGVGLNKFRHNKLSGTASSAPQSWLWLFRLAGWAALATPVSH